MFGRRNKVLAKSEKLLKSRVDLEQFGQSPKHEGSLLTATVLHSYGPPLVFGIVKQHHCSTE
jgi:hypothetical protein